MLDRLKPHRGSRRPQKRVGRGTASGSGRTCGRGQKGAGARSGHKKRTWFEGGQMPLARRLPKRGFTNIFREERQIVNVRDLTRFAAGAQIDAAALVAAGLVARADRPVKLLANGALTEALTVRVTAASAAAVKKIESAGGKVEVTEAGKAKAVAKKKKKAAPRQAAQPPAASREETEKGDGPS